MTSQRGVTQRLITSRAPRRLPTRRAALRFDERACPAQSSERRARLLEHLAFAVARVGLGAPPGRFDRGPAVRREDQVDPGLVHPLPDLPPGGRAAVPEMEVDRGDDRKYLRRPHSALVCRAALRRLTKANKKRALVTGCSGLIGSEAVAFLDARGWTRARRRQQHAPRLLRRRTATRRWNLRAPAARRRAASSTTTSTSATATAIARPRRERAARADRPLRRAAVARPRRAAGRSTTSTSTPSAR